MTGQVIPVNPASSVRGPLHSVKRGKTPVLNQPEAVRLVAISKKMTADDVRAALAAGQRTFGEIIAELQKEFGTTDPGKIRSDIAMFLEQLQKKRIVDY